MTSRHLMTSRFHLTLVLPNSRKKQSDAQVMRWGVVSVYKILMSGKKKKKNLHSLLNTLPICIASFKPSLSLLQPVVPIAEQLCLSAGRHPQGGSAPQREAGLRALSAWTQALVWNSYLGDGDLREKTVTLRLKHKSCGVCGWPWEVPSIFVKVSGETGKCNWRNQRASRIFIWYLLPHTQGLLMIERVGLNIVIQVVFSEKVIIQQKGWDFFLNRIPLMPMKIHPGKRWAKYCSFFGTEFLF